MTVMVIDNKKKKEVHQSKDGNLLRKKLSMRSIMWTWDDDYVKFIHP